MNASQRPSPASPTRPARPIRRCAPALTALLLVSPAALAQLPGLISQPLAGGGQSWSLPVQTLVLLTSLTFLPAMLLMMTSFTRIIIVLGLLRNALGTPSAPPNQVMLGLTLFLTFFIMSPVFDKVYQDAYLPFSQDKIALDVAMEKGRNRCANLCCARRGKPIWRCTPGWPISRRWPARRRCRCASCCRPTSPAS
ncbi:Flagellar biosynthetic protein fliP precursor [Serratia rubidaea]|uniref:Flagellar biosynthetic protein FliP n=1 Tax=Serratia rubidaea TaxID=61652 RepID=A0A4U9HIX0_SERRU|nr:Flagellar biosynthetic protein fliP precursor [Serratia rubidaea]